jgi:anti-sigma factor RsiW
MNCREVRDLLTGVGEPTEVRTHIEDCPECATYAERLDSARKALRDHHETFEPDAGFALRVADRLNGRTPELLGWAAARLLPATLVLLAVLGVLAFRALPALEVAEEVTSPTDNVLAWVLGDDGETP